MLDFLLKHAESEPVSFYMPGHKGSAIFRKYGFDKALDNFVDMDVTEIAGADNLFQTEGIIKDVQDRYAKLYDVDHSYLLINGTSGGVIAGILATVEPGKKLIMARNCHKCVFNALTLGHIEPVYAHPNLVQRYGVMGGVDAMEISKLISENLDAEAVIIPSPNYYGICSDIKTIAEVVHKAGKVLIVDQAHGAHLKFFHKYQADEDMPVAAEDCGADIGINSIHKTMASLTQSAVLNLRSDRIYRFTLEDKLQAIQSTSPSYILMTFLDINAKILEEHGTEVMDNWKRNLDYFYDEAGNIPGLRVMGKAADSELGYGDSNESMLLDRTKINLDLSSYGIGGAEFERLLNRRGIFPELYAGDLLMLMTGIGNTKEHMERTLTAIKEIISDHNLTGESKKITDEDHAVVPEPGKLHPIPRDKEFLEIKKAAGRICAGSIIPYPPGSPLVCPGEEITSDIADYILKLRSSGEKVLGIDDANRVAVGI